MVKKLGKEVDAFFGDMIDDLTDVVKTKVEEALAESSIRNILQEHDEADPRKFLAISEGAEHSQQAIYGDIICVRRIGQLVEHYGVFIDRDHVIHYTPPEGELGLDMCVRETTLDQFLNGQQSYFICLFPEDYPEEADDEMTPVDYSGKIVKERKEFLKNFLKDWLPFFSWSESPEYHLYSPEETVKRAKQRIGESRYNLVTNNCEHFALWCKTNISESHQINKLLKDLCKFPMQDK